MPRPPKYVSRADLGWGASPATRANPRSGLVIHYDSANQGLAGKNHSACLTYWRNTRSFHTGSSRGWADIGYSFMACAHGYVIEGRGLYKTQAAQPGGNTTHYSCTLATGPSDEVTDAQINAVRALRQWLMEPDTSIAGTVLGHRDFISTSCPGDKAYELVRDGTFTQPPGAPIDGITEDDMSGIIGLKIGDKGEEVVGLQYLVRAIGPQITPDGDYGPATAEGVRQGRAYVGSRAEAGYGDEITGAAYAQLMRAVSKREAEKLIAGLELPGGGSGGSVDASDLVGKTVTSKITGVK